MEYDRSSSGKLGERCHSRRRDADNRSPCEDAHTQGGDTKAHRDALRIVWHDGATARAQAYRDATAQTDANYRRDLLYVLTRLTRDNMALCSR